MRKYTKNFGMPPSGIYRVVEAVAMETDIYKVTLDSEMGDVFDTLYFTSNYNELSEVVGGSVEITFKTEVYNGVSEVRIIDFTNYNKINTIDANKQTTTLLTEIQENAIEGLSMLTYISNDVPYQNIKLYCSKAVTKSSNKASWLEMTLLDSKMNIIKGRAFSMYDYAKKDLEHKVLNIVGMRNKFGITVQMVTVYEDEQNIASRQFIKSQISYKYVVEYLQKHTYCEYLQKLLKSSILPTLQNSTDDVSGLIGYIPYQMAVAIQVLSVWENISSNMKIPEMIFMELIDIIVKANESPIPIEVRKYNVLSEMGVTRDEITALYNFFSKEDTPEKAIMNNYDLTKESLFAIGGIL